VPVARISATPPEVSAGQCFRSPAFAVQVTVPAALAPADSSARATGNVKAITPASNSAGEAGNFRADIGPPLL